MKRNRFSHGEGELRGRKAGLALVSVLLVFCIIAQGCGWELATYRTLNEAQVGYEGYYGEVVKMHEQGQVSDALYAKAKDVAQRIYDLGQGASQMMVAYEQIKDPAIKSKIDAAIAELPGLISTLVQIRNGVSPSSSVKQAKKEFASLNRIERDLDAIETLRPKYQGPPLELAAAMEVPR